MTTFLRCFAFLLAFLLPPVAAGAAGVIRTMAAMHTTPDAAPPRPANAGAAHDPDKPTAVVVLGANGAQVTDVLAPYEVLATTGAFNLYTVAPEPVPVPLTGGLDLVPDLTFAELDRRLDGAADLVVVPALPDVGEPSTAPVTAWLRRQAARGGGLLLSVCNGGQVLASAGLLDGRDATSHWTRIATLEDRYPQVRWVRGTRYVEDGDVMTTGGVLSGVDGSLRAVERLVGTEAARDTATAIAWPYHSPGTPASMPAARIAAADAIVALNAYRWNPATFGVLLTDNVGEIELASAFDTFGGESLAARTVAVGASRTAVTSRHGLSFVPRSDLHSAGPRLDQLLVPGADAARLRDADLAAHATVEHGLTPQYLHGRPGFPFDATLRSLARTLDVPTARWTAKALEYPAANLNLTGPTWPWTLALRPLALGLAGLAVAVRLDALLRARRRAHT